MAIRFLILALIIAGCGKKAVDQQQNPVAGPGPELWVVTSDYTSGLLQRVSLTDNRVVNDEDIPIHGDAVMRGNREHLFVVNRLGRDSVLVLSRETRKVVGNYSVGGLNAQDFLWLSGSLAYVTRMESKHILQVHPTTGKSAGPNIDLSSYADDDGIPEMSEMAFIDGKVWLQIKRLKKYKPTNYSSVAVIQPQTGDLQVVPLTGLNPVTDFKVGADEKIYVGEAGYLGLESKLDGGIDQIDPKSRQVKGWVVTEQELGGDIADFEILSATLGVATIDLPAAGKSKLVLFNPTTHKLTKVVAEGEAYAFSKIVWDKKRDAVYWIDRDKRRPRIRNFSISQMKEREELSWEFKLPPYQMQLLD